MNIKALTDELLHNRAMATNTQLHIEGLELAFNSEASDSQIERLKTNIEKGKKNYQTILQELHEVECNPQIDPIKIKEEIRRWEKLEEYFPRLESTLYQKSIWQPVISPYDPIQPLTRTIGFATKNGQRNETTTKLNFADILGKDKLNLNATERHLLSELLLACDSAVTRDPSFILQWEKSKKPTAEIAKVLEDFHSTDCPHLSDLFLKQIESLVSKGLRFAFEVNFHLANDLLNL